MEKRSTLPINIWYVLIILIPPVAFVWMLGDIGELRTNIALFFAFWGNLAVVLALRDFFRGLEKETQ